ncbi:hypothetical protein C5167_018342, partial [Papaver somniferum]
SLEVAGGDGADVFLSCSIFFFLTGYGGLRPTLAKLHSKCLRKIPKETNEQHLGTTTLGILYSMVLVALYLGL